MVACKNCHDPHTVKNGFVRAKQRYNVNCVGIISCLATSGIRTPRRSKKPYVLSYTPWEKPRLAFWPNSWGCHARQPITGFAKRLPVPMNQP